MKVERRRKAALGKGATRAQSRVSCIALVAASLGVVPGTVLAKEFSSTPFFMLLGTMFLAFCNGAVLRAAYVRWSTLRRDDREAP